MMVETINTNGEKLVFTIKDLIATVALLLSFIGIFVGFSARVRAMELTLTERLVRIEAKLEAHMDPVTGIHESSEQKMRRVKDEVGNHEERLHK